ncbi:MAG TPA: ABC transporter substrate-binding protein, partial [Verrucomicrobiae bacterium]|nr:ABC transporter substrate-binding protein [Verrucomicrobiae bacterium]
MNAINEAYGVYPMDPVKDLPKTSRRNLMCWGITGATIGLIGPLLAGCASSAPPPPTTVPAATSAPTSVPAATSTAAAPQASRPTPAAAQPTTVSQASAAAPSGPQEIIVADAFFSTGNTAGDLAELDPARRGTWGFESLLWAPLVASDAETNPLPAKSLATSWETSEDGKTYTFHLRPEAKFSDGKPITAQDVVDSIGYLAMMNHNEARGYRDNFASAAQRFFYDVEGFLDVANKVPYDPFGTPAVPGVKATDDHTVQITIMAPSATFIKRVMFAVGVFRKSDLEAARNMKLDQLDFWSAHAANSGQYKLSKAVPGDHYEMVPNENYFGPPGKLTKITVKAVGSDPNT